MIGKSRLLTFRKPFRNRPLLPSLRRPSWPGHHPTGLPPPALLPTATAAPSSKPARVFISSTVKGKILPRAHEERPSRSCGSQLQIPGAPDRSANTPGRPLPEPMALPSACNILMAPPSGLAGGPGHTVQPAPPQLSIPFSRFLLLNISHHPNTKYLMITFVSLIKM